MSKLKAIIAHIFESNWIYSDDYSTRTHKKTGKVEYSMRDDWGYLWADSPWY
jgi:hypothetical protein